MSSTASGAHESGRALLAWLPNGALSDIERHCEEDESSVEMTEEDGQLMLQVSSLLLLTNQ